MASATPLKDIDEQFLRCCICMEQLKEPKMLPCLHRYCHDCLKKVFKEKTEIECPTCREVHKLPEEGIDGLKTDFNTNNIVEFIQLQRSIEVDPLRTCIHCRKKLKASAFCFKCNDSLCESCHEFHASSLMMEDHHPHIFSLSEAGARNLTIQKLSSLQMAPRCLTHPGELSKLGCMTCGNQPICIPCSYGAHQGHNLKEVTSLARIEREKLTGKIAALMQYKDNVYQMHEEIKKTKENLVRKTEEERQKLQEQLAAEEETIGRNIRDTDEELTKKQEQLKEKLGKKTSMRKQVLERTIREARDEYERICEEERQEADADLQKLQQENEREKEQLQKGLDIINNNIQDLLVSLKAQEEENTEKIGELTDHHDDIVKRFETVTTTASSILAAENYWADVQCIPDICRAVDLLSEEVKKDHSESLSNRIIRQKVDISEVEELVVNINGDGITKWEINGITSNAAGSIVISGKASTNTESHLTVINIEGDVIKQTILKVTSGSWCYCDFLSQSHIASVCGNGEVGVYDIRDSSYRKINIKNVISSCPNDLWALNIATDRLNSHILVGSQNGDVYVFDSQLKFMRTLKLPEIALSARDLALLNGDFLVCDYNGKQAFAVTVNGSDTQLKYKFTKPDLYGSNWVPRSVCTDNSGNIYMLWLQSASEKSRVIIVQYEQDGGQIRAIRQVNRNHHAECITWAKTENGVKLLLPTWNTGLLLTYDLKESAP